MHAIQWIEKDRLEEILPILQLLNEKTDTAILAQRLKEMKAHNYRCAGAYAEGRLIGICGAWILHKHYVGKHIELDNVMLLPEYRRLGIGEAMIAWLEAWAKSEGCVAGELNCYVQNSAGLKFWLNQGYRVLGFHCQKKF